MLAGSLAESRTEVRRLEGELAEHRAELTALLGEKNMQYTILEKFREQVSGLCRSSAKRGWYGMSLQPRLAWQSIIWRPRSMIAFSAGGQVEELGGDSRRWGATALRALASSCGL